MICDLNKLSKRQQYAVIVCLGMLFYCWIALGFTSYGYSLEFFRCLFMDSGPWLETLWESFPSNQEAYWETLWESFPSNQEAYWETLWESFPQVREKLLNWEC